MENELKPKRNIPASLAHLRGVYDRAVIVHSQHGRQLNAYNMEVNKQAAIVQRRIEATDPNRRDEAAKLYNAEHNDWLKNYRAETSAARWKDAGELNTLRADAIEAKAMLTNTRALATNWNLGESRRSSIESSLHGLQKAALGNVAARAMAEPDKDKQRDILAALVVTIDKMPRGDRPEVSSQEIADAGFREEAEQASKLIATIDRLSAESIAAVRSTEGNPLTPTEKLSHGLRHGPGRAVPVSPTVLARPKTPNSKIAAALAR